MKKICLPSWSWYISPLQPFIPDSHIHSITTRCHNLFFHGAYLLSAYILISLTTINRTQSFREYIYFVIDNLVQQCDFPFVVRIYHLGHYNNPSLSLSSIAEATFLQTVPVHTFYISIIFSTVPFFLKTGCFTWSHLLKATEQNLLQLVGNSLGLFIWQMILHFTVLPNKLPLDDKMNLSWKKFLNITLWFIFF